MVDGPNGVTLKAFVPELGQSFTGVILGNPSDMVNPSNPDARELSHAGQLSVDLGRTGWGLAGLVRPGAAFANAADKRSAFCKTNFYGVNSFVEGIVWEACGNRWWKTFITWSVSFGKG